MARLNIIEPVLCSILWVFETGAQLGYLYQSCTSPPGM
jgi:hypothetical protein